MSELLPSLEAKSVRESLLEYLTTTFALADKEERRVLHDFLADPESGIFKGPYVRLRLPFEAAPAGSEKVLGWYKGFPPYGHQAKAFARLSSANLTAEKPRPLPTLVTTGTGSGKTESFLYPILDHIIRRKAAGEGGVKALILYPMNALANDQARRIKDLILEHPELNGVRAALYSGQEGDERRTVSEAGLITDREAIREEAPDILLTNYKMLDQLLLRPADRSIWEQSATSLQYLVLDEFHTYDGAQGTDVAMLLRRLGLALKRYWADDDPEITDADRALPLGRVTLVATSATLGGDDPRAMIDFANTVFGGGFDETCLVGETRQSLESWCGDASDMLRAEGLDTLAESPATTLLATELVKIDEILDEQNLDDSAAEITAQVMARFFAHPSLGDQLSSATQIQPQQAIIEHFRHATPEQLLTAVKAQPFLLNLIRAATTPLSVAALAEELFPESSTTEREHATRLLIAALSHVRAVAGRGAVTVEIHQWVRAVTRVDRVANLTPKFWWGDDGARSYEDNDDPNSDSGRVAFPAIYCRKCGRTGWGVQLAATGMSLAPEGTDIRRNHLFRPKGDRFRALMYGAIEADAVYRAQEEGQHDHLPDRLHVLHVRDRELRSDHLPEELDGNEIPVVMFDDDRHGEDSRNDRCPCCDQNDAIRFLGSAIATLLSVSLTTIFGEVTLHESEKKALVFTDSVQDAAHRAAFVQSRSYVFNLRNAMCQAVGDEAVGLDALVERMMERAQTPAERYRILSPELCERPAFQPYWDPKERVTPAVTRRVRERLAFDVALEFGLQSGVGRTLIRTGSLTASVNAGSSEQLVRIARSVLTQTGMAGEVLELEGLSDGQLLAWTRGVLERMRERGAIQHPWLQKYLAENGSRWRVSGGRPRGKGMPAFPPGREAPAFPRFGSASVSGSASSGLDKADSTRGWYVYWTSEILRVPETEGRVLLKLLFKALSEHELVVESATAGGGTAYGLDQARVIVEPVSGADSSYLVCDSCDNEVRGNAQALAEYLAADGECPCTVMRCKGKLKAVRDGMNFYRRLYSDGDMRRVTAREHTSLLEDSVRLDVETAFKESADRADAPNVLVATPTLEMGIDIGDLSTVFLAGLPKTVSSYLQRVGRAGRLTGNALVMAFVVGQGVQLPKLGEPLSVIDGEVRPPATYLNAAEILRRQYVAYLIDGLAAQARIPEVRNAQDVFARDDPGSFIHTVITEAEEEGEVRLDEFLATFSNLEPGTAEQLRAWALPADGQHTSGVAQQFFQLRRQWLQDIEELRRRRAAIRDSLPELEQKAVASKDDERKYKTAQAMYVIAGKQLDSQRDEHWVSALERGGMLPNYTLLDDTVQLNVGVSWLDPDSGKYETDEANYQRGAANAITEFAPGSCFYAQGLEIEIDAVELGRGQNEVQRWAYCAECGYARNVDLPETDSSKPCPRCGSKTITDSQQIMHTLELERVSAQVRRDEAAITDRRDERRRKTFHVQTAADLNPEHLITQWFVDDKNFGLKYYRDMSIRWVNLGRVDGTGQERVVAGRLYGNSPLFRVCEACGQLDKRGEENSEHEHRAWCRHRKSREEHNLELALTRTLNSQGIVLRLPPSITIGGGLAVPSFAAAVRLGLRELIGGEPDHLAITTIEEPLTGEDGTTSTALLIHDLVPGGTGYLADLATSEKIREVLEAAWNVVSTCPCEHEDRLACHRCLLPYPMGNSRLTLSRVSAMNSLKELLGIGENGEGTPWQCTTVDPGPASPESALEQWFRQVFIDKVEAEGGNITEIPGTWGNTLRVTFPHSPLWTLTPQVDELGSRPDFKLECADPTIPAVLIFADGQRFHSTQTINRIADDARKREVLRNAGHRVLSVTWDDLERAQKPGRDSDIYLHRWIKRSRIREMASARFGLGSTQLEFIKMNPMKMLLLWMKNHATTAKTLETVGTCIPFFAMLTGHRNEAQYDHEHRLADALAQRGVTAPVNFHRSGAALMAMWGMHGAVLSLDDSPEAVASEEFVQSWRDWLHLGNVIGFAPAEKRAEITSRSSLSSAVTPAASMLVDLIQPSEAAGMSEVWQTLLEAATTTAGEKQQLMKLAQRGTIQAPEVGYETSDGIPLSLSWPEQKIVLDIGLEEDDYELLRDDEWTIVAPDIDAVEAALKGA